MDLQPEAYRDEITVTATPGRAVALEDVPQRVNVIGEEEIALRAKTVLAQAVNEETGLRLQRTSPTIAGVFVRGLTGTKVNVYVDGVRYTTAAQRGGISTFFNMVDPEALEGIEVVRGPSSAEYGSDALGGTVQLLTRGPAFSPSGQRVSGSQLSASHVRGQQDGGKRYDQLLGGDGNLVADLRNLMTDHLYARFEKARAGS